MIGTIPSYVDQAQFLSDDSLYPQQLANMYTAPRYPAQSDRAAFPPPHQQHPAPGYEAYDAQAIFPQPMPELDFQNASFSDVGAAFGFNPDVPIQIPATQLPQSPTSLIPGFNAPYPPHMLPPQQQPFGGPQMGAEGYPVPGNGHEHWGARRGGSNYKRPRISQEDSDDDDFNMDNSRPTRLPGACVHCKQLKVRCEFLPGHDVCNRCRGGKKECVVLGRKPRRPPPKREDLQNKIREQEATIAELRSRLERAKISTSSDAPSTAASPKAHGATNSVASPTSATVPDKAIQEWIEQARENAHTAGDLEPSAVVGEDPLSEPAETDEEDFDEELDQPEMLSPQSAAVTADSAQSTRSPAVGTTLSPIGMIAHTALRNRVRSQANSLDGEAEELGVANASYFRPGVSTNPGLRWSVRASQPPPRIFSQGLVSPRDVDKLFHIFFDKMNLSVSLLDPRIYTAQTTYWRSPFLFTVICAIASRYLSERPELYPILMNFAKIEAGQALVTGLKSVELVAGYILLSLYPVPSTRWEEDRGWLMLGVAIRMATDLNLHHSLNAKTQNESQRREAANRTRIWMNCYNLDRSTSTQFGKPSTIKEDYTARHSKFWYRRTGFNYDIHLNGYTQLLRVMGRFHEAIYSNPDEPSGLNKNCDFEALTEKYENELVAHWDEWEPIFDEESDKSSVHCLYRIELLRLASAYSRLVIMSFRFQHAYQNKNLNRGDPFLQRCLDTASSVVKIVVDNMAPYQFLQTAPDAQFVFASFASVFMLKLLRPRFASFLEAHQKQEITSLIGRLIEVLQSDEVSVDERHTPKLYARFLGGLLNRQLARSSLSGSSPRGSEQPSSPPADPSASFEYHQLQMQAQTQKGFKMKAEATPEAFLRQHQQQEVPAVQVTQAASDPASVNATANSYPIYEVTPPSPRSMNLMNTPSASSIHDGSDTISIMTEYVGGGSANMGMNSMPRMGAIPTGDDAMLAPMRAITNPTFWDDMMMPGFSWTPMDTTPPDFFQQFATASS
ncbi:hypothetical protein M422DRAFT_222838 [Sphaerobolus stellatus SS14]|nr:hypothetical protein M422DRAFT_222838 [Sphaerobolus stellatus SS14]